MIYVKRVIIILLSSINSYINKYGDNDLIRKIVIDRNRKYKEYIENADEFHLYEQKDMFCDMYFHESFDKVLPKIKRLINYYDSFGSNNDIIEMLYNKLNEFDDEDVIKNMLNEPINSSLLDIMNNEIKRAKYNAKISIINAINDGNCILIHKTDNISEEEWKNRTQNISCSLITSNNHTQTWECGKYSLGFVISEPSEIIAMGSKDLDANMKSNNLDEDFLTAADLIKRTKHHNEVIITAKYPSYVICYDTLTEESIKAAESLEIPIFGLCYGEIISNKSLK